jgi:hypothetical protein
VVRINPRNSNGAKLRELTGTTPDGNTAAGVMDEVSRNPTSQLTLADLAALMASLRSRAAATNLPINFCCCPGRCRKFLLLAICAIALTETLNDHTLAGDTYPCAKYFK